MTDDQRLADRRALAERMIEARLRTAFVRRSEVSKEEMALLVGALLGRTVHPTQWRRYENGESEPPLEVIKATARISGLSEHYIAFGSDSAGGSAAMPSGGVSVPDPSLDRQLTPDEIERARAKSDEAAAQKARGTGTGGRKTPPPKNDRRTRGK